MHEPKDVILETTREVFTKAGFDAEITWQDAAIPRIAVVAAQGPMLIGKQGTTLQALEHLIRLVVVRKLQDHSTDFILDINDYRREQTEELIAIAKEKAALVLASGKAESLAPMSSYERKVVHTELASFTGLHTESIGAEPHRRVVIKPA